MPADQIVHFQAAQAAARLDQYLAQEFPSLSRSQLKKLIQDGKVLVANRRVKPNTAIEPGDQISLQLPHPQNETPTAETIPLDIIYDDADLIIINKPAGMVVHPGHGHDSGTLVNALLALYPDLAVLGRTGSDGGERPGIVHRLDQDTSGLLIVARTAETLKVLQRQFKSRTVEKTYLALVFGHLPAPEGVIDVPLGRDPRHRQKIAPRPDGKPARTRYRVIESYVEYSLLEIGLETGRTHQIRVHLAWLGCPVVGDTVYGRRRNSLGLTRQFLHAWQLQFKHPRTGESVSFEAPLAANLAAVLADLRGV